MNPETRRHLSRFLVVGFLSVAVDGATYVAFMRLGLERNISKGISYILGMALGFILNKVWTFGSERRSASEPLTYVILYALTLAVNMGVNAAVLAQLGDFSQAKSLAFLAATGTTTVLNFLGMRFVTFKKGIEERRRTT